MSAVIRVTLISDRLLFEWYELDYAMETVTNRVAAEILSMNLKIVLTTYLLSGDPS